jgi:hypothetical protein
MPDRGAFVTLWRRVLSAALYARAHLRLVVSMPALVFLHCF